MKNILVLLAFTSSIYAYEACGVDRKEALTNLSGTIKSRVNQEYTEEIKSVNDEDSVESKISSYINTSTNLTLVNIDYTKKNNEICAKVNKQDQAKNTRKLLNKALMYKQSNLPNNIDEKINKLSIWLKDIKELSYLIPAFLDDVQTQQNTLNEKEKAFQDLYNDAIKESNSLVWRTCKKSKEEAKDALNKLLFVNKGKKEDVGFWASLTSVFTPSQNPDIDLFDEQVSYIKKGSKECAMIKKEDLLKVSKSMNFEVKRFSEKSLNKNPLKRYTQIKELSKQFIITKKLISLYPNTFKNADFSNINRAEAILNKSRESTHPQFVIFQIKNGTNIDIKLDKNTVEKNKKIWLKVGEHTYTIQAKDRCPINASFEMSLKENETISQDFNDYKYPSVIFITDKSPNIVIDGNIFTVNKKNFIKKCSDEPMRYLAKFSNQTRKGEIDVSANAKNTIELKFLSSKELAIFNDAKTKNYKTTTQKKFSESLTPLTSKNLEFSVSSSVDHGDLDLHEAGSFTYISEKDFVGIDSFEYTITANGEESAPKVVNIRVEKSDAPVAIVPVVIPKDNNTTKQEPKQEKKKKEEPKKEEKKEKKEVKEKTTKTKELTQEEKEKKYQRFKKYVESQKQDMQKLEKLQQSYPEMFGRLLKEKTSAGQ